MTTFLDTNAVARDVIITCCSLATPMFFLFMVFEITLNNPPMVLLTAAGGLVCLVNLVAAIYRRTSLFLLRSTFFFVMTIILYYVSTDFLASSLLFCLIVPFMTSIILGHREAVWWNVAFGLCCYTLIVNAPALGITTIVDQHVDFVATFGLAMIISYAFENLRNRAEQRAAQENARLLAEIRKRDGITRENQELIRKLTQTANEVQELSGLVPICSSCKNVRDDEGYWQGVEAYLHSRTRLKFSHGYCPSCAKATMDELGLE